jgi:hypothetical protein
MKHERDEDRLDELIAQAVNLGKVELDRGKWLDKLATTAPAPSRSGTSVEHVKLHYPGMVWRKIMESKLTRYSVAAVVALAAAVVLLNPFGTSTNGVALAAVQARIAQVDTMVLRGETTFTSITDPNISLRYDNVKYLSRQQGFAEDGFIKGTLAYRLILNRPEKQALLLLPAWKKYLKFAGTEEQIRVVERLTPTGVVDLLLETEYQRLGTAVIDGVEAEGFEVQDLKPLESIMPRFLLDLRQARATLWVGKKELLPIRGEADMVLGGTVMTLFMDVHCHEVTVLEKYNVELGSGLFDIRPPEGYTELKLTDFIPGRLDRTN